MWLSPEPVHEVKIRIQRGKGIRGADYDAESRSVGPEFMNPESKAGEAGNHYKNKWWMICIWVFSWSADRGIESGKVFYYWIYIQQVELIPARGEFEMTPCELGRTKMNFSLMYEKQVFLMGLPVK